MADVQEIVTTAIGGKVATHVYEGERRFQLTLRFPELQRNSIGTIGEIRVKSASGALIPMSELATIEMREGPSRISREHVKRRIYIGFNVVGRDIGGVVDEGRKKLAAQVRLPEGYQVTWGGAFENMERANARLLIVVPITLGLVFFLLLLGFSLAPLRDVDHYESPLRLDRGRRVSVAERAIPERAGLHRLYRTIRLGGRERDRAGLLYQSVAQ